MFKIIAFVGMDTVGFTSALIEYLQWAEHYAQNFHELSHLIHSLEWKPTQAGIFVSFLHSSLFSAQSSTWHKIGIQ